MFVMRLIEVMQPGASPTPYDGQFLQEYDPNRDGISPDGKRMLAHLVCTPEPREAMRFANPGIAWQQWLLVDERNPVRPDGKPNRPLSAFSISIEEEASTREWQLS